MAKKMLSHEKTKALLPVLNQFNKLAQIFIKSLTKKVEREKNELSKIAVMVSGMKLPEKHHNISIQTLDMNQTRVKKKGDSTYNQVMDWEKDFRKKSKGIIL